MDIDGRLQRCTFLLICTMHPFDSFFLSFGNAGVLALRLLVFLEYRYNQRGRLDSVDKNKLLQVRIPLEQDSTAHHRKKNYLDDNHKTQYNFFREDIHQVSYQGRIVPIELMIFFHRRKSQNLYSKCIL